MAIVAERADRDVAPAQTRDEEYTSHALVDDSWMSPQERALLDAARGLAPLLAERERRCQAEGNVPPETISEFHRLGLARIVQPRRYGGLGGTSLLLSRVVEELAMGCASSAWVLGVYCEHAWVLAALPAQAQEEIWGQDPHAVAASSLAPRAAATVVPGGYRLSGTYPFASGCKHAEWIIIGAWVGEGDARHLRYLVMPMADVEILDDWQTLGLRGTGSNTVALHDVFVPEHRTVADALLHKAQSPGREVHPDFPMMRAPRRALAIFTQMPVTLALARRILRHTCINMRGRVSRGMIKLYDSQVVQMKIGESAASIESAITIAHQRHRRTVEMLLAGQPLSQGDVLACVRDSVWANRTARQAIDTLISVSSAEIVHDRNDIQTWYRDALTTGVHFAANWENAMVPYGRLQLGFPG